MLIGLSEISPSDDVKAELIKQVEAVVDLNFLELQRLRLKLVEKLIEFNRDVLVVDLVASISEVVKNADYRAYELGKGQEENDVDGQVDLSPDEIRTIKNAVIALISKL